MEFSDGISEISALNQQCVLAGNMRGQVIFFNLEQLSEESIRTVGPLPHRAPVKCIRWQPGQESVFATASQDGSVAFCDLRCAMPLIGTFGGAHGLDLRPGARTTMTGLVFHPQQPTLFYTSGTPDSSVRLWDMRLLPHYSKHSPAAGRRHNRGSVRQFAPVAELSATSTIQGRRQRSSVALAINSTGARIFLATSNDNIYEFVSDRGETGPVASYTAPGYTSCSFFSNVTVDPTDRFLLSGSADGNAYLWNMDCDDAARVFRLPVSAQLEVSKTAWAAGRGPYEATIGCISDDLSVSLFQWGRDVDESSRSESVRRPVSLPHAGRESLVHEASDVVSRETAPANAKPPRDCLSPSTPVKRTDRTASLPQSPQTPANKSILDFFPRSPRL